MSCGSTEYRTKINIGVGGLKELMWLNKREFFLFWGSSFLFAEPTPFSSVFLPFYSIKIIPDQIGVPFLASSEGMAASYSSLTVWSRTFFRSMSFTRKRRCRIRANVRTKSCRCLATSTLSIDHCAPSFAVNNYVSTLREQFCFSRMEAHFHTCMMKKTLSPRRQIRDAARKHQLVKRAEKNALGKKILSWDSVNQRA